MDKETVRSVKVIYQELDDYRTFPATGIFVTPAASGDIIFKFFVETQPPPDEVQIVVQEDGTLEEKPFHEEPGLYIRSFVTGVMVNPYNAKAIGEFIVQKAEETIQKAAEISKVQ